MNTIKFSKEKIEQSPTQMEINAGFFLQSVLFHSGMEVQRMPWQSEAEFEAVLEKLKTTPEECHPELIKKKGPRLIVTREEYEENKRRIHERSRKEFPNPIYDEYERIAKEKELNREKK